MIHGVIDIGSNTVRLNVYVYKNHQFKLLISKKEKLGLAMYVKNRILSEEGIEKTILVLKTLKNDLKILKIKNFSFFATASLRNIKNRSKVIETIEKSANININLISGEKEGELSFIGAKKSLKMNSGILVDIGGGSTEIVFFNKKKVKSCYSIPLGSLMIYKEYVSKLLPSKREKRLIEKRVLYELDKSSIKKNESCKKYLKNDERFICGVGGTFRTSKEMIESLDIEKNGDFISPKSLKIIEDELKENIEETYHKILKVKPSRTHTFIPGILIIKSIVSYFKCNKIQISNYGIREGYLYDEIMRDMK